MLRYAPLLALSLVLCPYRAVTQESSPEAIQMLNRVADHYINAKFVHLEATTSRSSHSELYNYSTTSHLIALMADGNRFRYDGRTSNGSSLIVSDGKREWHLRRSFGQYDEASTGSFFRRPSSAGSDDDAPVEARYLVTSVTQMRDHIEFARFAPSELIEYRGQKVKCTVIQFEYKQRLDRGPGSPIAWRNTVWIDPANLIILKSEYRDRHQLSQGMAMPPRADWREERNETIFILADLNSPLPTDTFAFTAPSDVIRVAALPSLFPIPGDKDPAISPGTAQYVGKPLPSIVLHDSAGGEVSLSRYRGHPMLIEVWATWCGPCIHDMPTFGRLRASTSSTGLQIIGIDEDEKTADAIAYLRRNHYDWPDYHLTEGAAKDLSAFGIPVTLLVDAKGDVVYYHLGENNLKDLIAAIPSLGPAYANASAE